MYHTPPHKSVLDRWQACGGAASETIANFKTMTTTKTEVINCTKWRDKEIGEMHIVFGEWFGPA